MNNLGMRILLTLGLLALAAAPAHAERYVVEPIVDEVATPVEDAAGFTQAELDQMLAPVALYPDALLSQILVAATYPLEIVEAARWSRQNPQLEGEEAVNAIADRDWDPSVKSLVAFPDLLARLDEDLDWTRSLGDAMLYQEEQVMDSIQFLRARADAAGQLESNEYARVIREEETIIIEPAQTRVVHVPYYDPYVVYGSWWWPAYPPVVWARPTYYYHGHPGYYWSSGIHLSSGFFFSSFYWPQRSVVIVHTPRYYHPPRHRSSRHYYTPGQRWKHNPIHRRGVAYRHDDVRQRYDRPRLKAGPATRWPLQSGSARADSGSRLDASRRSHRTASAGEWRDRNVRERDGSVRAARREVSSASSPSRDSGARLTAGPRTIRPNVAATGERLRSTRGTARTQQRTVSAPQRSAAVTQRMATPSRPATANSRTATTAPRATSAPRATAPAQRSAAATAPRATSRGDSRARVSSRSSAAAAPAAAPQSRATGRSNARGAESRAASMAESSKRGTNSGRGGSARGDRRFD